EVTLVRLQGSLGGQREASVNALVGVDFDGEGKGQGKSLHVANGFADGGSPECNYRNAATVAAFHGFAHGVRLRGGAGEMEDVVFAPLVAGALIGPHVVGLGFGVGEFGIEAMLLFDDTVDCQVCGADVFVFDRGEEEIREVVVSFDGQGALDRRADRIQNVRGDFDALASAKFAARVHDLGLVEVEDEVAFFSG